MSLKLFHRAFHWEYWPSSMLYVPNLPYAFYLAAKAKHAAFFSAANPSLKSSGNGTESKFCTIQLVPEKFRPKTILHAANSKLENTLFELKNTTINYPIIVKPDVGFRGLLVKKVETEQELVSYLKKYPVDIIIQEYVEFKNECGIFYTRNPNVKKGKISSITLKKFLTVIGDGSKSLKDLIVHHKRASLYKTLIFEIHENSLADVPKKGEEIILSVIGNHSKGTQFLNGNHLISKSLEETFDQISEAIPGWYYGRIDLKYNDFTELENGKNFKVLEINGIIAEPTHIYDSKQSSYFKALKAIRSHWKSLYYISITNHLEHKIPYKSAKVFLSEMFQLRAYTKHLKSIQ